MFYFYVVKKLQGGFILVIIKVLSAHRFSYKAMH